LKKLLLVESIVSALGVALEAPALKVAAPRVEQPWQAMGVFSRSLAAKTAGMEVAASIDDERADEEDGGER